MGEARNKLLADADGVPRPRDERCPGCASKRIFAIPTAELRHLGADVDWQGCLDCPAFWEPFPKTYARDPVAAEPCDNCAFRPGSPEQQDPARWRHLINQLKPDAHEANGYGFFRGRFYCHKGVPIDMSKGPGNFLFPRKAVTMNGEPVRNPDGSIVTTEDIARMRTCSGFLRMVWAHRDKHGI